MKIRNLAVLALAFALAGCYHAIIDTGKPASGTVIEDPWAMSFVAGLIPPETVDVASRCPDGVSRVETQHSFLNSLVAGITSGIITPMTITVTCAAGNMEEPDADAPDPVIDVESPDLEALARALNDAAVQSWQRAGPVYVSVRAD